MTETVVRKDQSIHPRVVGGRTKYTKSNTMKVKDKSTIQRVIAAISNHLEEHPRDRFSQEHLNKLQKQL